MELSFRRMVVGDRVVKVLSVKSDTETDFKDTTRIETAHSNMIVTDVFDVLKKIDHKVDEEGNFYDWYYVENHYQTQERFTPEKQDVVDGTLADHSAKLDYIAMMSDIDIEEV